MARATVVKSPKFYTDPHVYTFIPHATTAPGNERKLRATDNIMCYVLLKYLHSVEMFGVPPRVRRPG